MSSKSLFTPDRRGWPLNTSNPSRLRTGSQESSVDARPCSTPCRTAPRMLPYTGPSTKNAGATNRLIARDNPSVLRTRRPMEAPHQKRRCAKAPPYRFSRAGVAGNEYWANYNQFPRKFPSPRFNLPKPVKTYSEMGVFPIDNSPKIPQRDGTVLKYPNRQVIDKTPVRIVRTSTPQRHRSKQQGEARVHKTHPL